MISLPAVAAVVTSVLLAFGAITNGQASPSGAERASTGNPLWAVRLQMLAATRERPLFSPSRRPPSAPALAAAPALAPPPSANAPEPDRPRLSILGTVVGRSDAIAVLMEDANSNVLRLHAGQDYAGWVLRVVKRREVNFEKGNAVATLTLPAPGTEKPTAPTAGAPPDERQAISPAPAAIAQISASPAAPRERRRRD